MYMQLHICHIHIMLLSYLLLSKVNKLETEEWTITPVASLMWASIATDIIALCVQLPIGLTDIQMICSHKFLQIIKRQKIEEE